MRLLLKLVALIILIPVAYGAWTAAVVLQTSDKDERDPADAIVVMGAAQYNGKPSVVFKARLDHARELYDAGVAPLIVVLGGKQAGDKFTEAQAGAAYLEQDLPIDRVTGVKSGRTTLDSLEKFTGLARERQIKSVVIVSDPLHLARAKQIARDQGFEVSVSGSNIRESDEHRGAVLVRETVTLGYYRLFKRDISRPT